MRIHYAFTLWRFAILILMKTPILAKLDRRLLFGVAVSGISLVLMGIGLFAVVSAFTDDAVQLQQEGSIQDIVGSNPGGPTTVPAVVGGQPIVPAGPKPIRIDISRVGVDAPIIELNVEPGTNTPAVPNSGDQVAWYDFSSTPGSGNSVFAGHVDWQTANGQPIPGAFYRIRELHIGDEITVTLEDNSVLKYRVTGNVAVQYNDPDVVKAMGPVSKDVVTLITCGGTWEKNPAEENGGNYTHRIVVRAERETDAATPASG